PTEFQLLPNYPNPFNPETRVRFRLKKNAAVNLVIRDIQGKRIRDLADREWYPAGDHQIVWDGKNERGFSASSGVYMIEMTVDGRRLAQRMVLIR
ncbi:MAG TPA: FlgD immunoglobulin-like domain containing protein, partial [Calditrichia bacterium]|nr:FlgD immunoglobulin-like domain containing protein [Calditrichia bacterium]